MAEMRQDGTISSAAADAGGAEVAEGTGGESQARDGLGGRPSPDARRAKPRDVVAGYVRLLGLSRARRTYAYVLVNAVLQSGVYTWLGVYLARRYHLGDVGIGLALLGYGVPGFLLGPLIGRVADRRGRARMVPAGLGVGAAAALLLAPPVPVVVAAAAVTLLSLGYDLTQPLLAGIVTQLPAKRGQAMGFNVFTLFVGFGLGSLAFQGLLDATGFTVALVVFGAGAALGAALAVPLFAGERPAATRPDPERAGS